MPYDKKSPMLQPFGTQAGSSAASTGIPSSSNSYVCTQACRVTRIGYYVSVVMNSSAAIVIDVYRSAVLNSVTSQTVIGRLTIPATQAIDKIIYKDVTPANCNVGDHILMNVVTAATTSGSGFLVVEADLDPEVPLNQSKYIASA